MTSPSSCVLLAVQPSHVAPGGHAWTATGWAVIAAWTAVLAALARAAYRRDTERIDIERHLTDKESSSGPHRSRRWTDASVSSGSPPDEQRARR